MLTIASTAAILILSTSMAVGIGKYLRSKTRGRSTTWKIRFAVDATAAVDAVREDLHTSSTVLKIRGQHYRRGRCGTAVDAVAVDAENTRSTRYFRI